MGNKEQQTKYFQLAMENDPDTMAQFMKDNRDYIYKNLDNPLFNNE